jgi:hypothetical protein
METTLSTIVVAVTVASLEIPYPLNPSSSQQLSYLSTTRTLATSSIVTAMAVTAQE